MTRAVILATLLCASISAPALAQEVEDGSEAPSAPSVAPALQAPAEVRTQEPEEVPRGFSVKVWGGPAYHQIFSVPMTSADVGLALGGQIRHVAIYGGTDLSLGSTQFGLKTTQVRSMASIEARYGRWRLGAGLDVTYLAIQRATSGPVMNSYGAGLTLLLSVDLIRSETGRALFLGGSLGEDLLVPFFAGNDASESWIWGAALGLGIRY